MASVFDDGEIILSNNHNLQSFIDSVESTLVEFRLPFFLSVSEEDWYEVELEKRTSRICFSHYHRPELKEIFEIDHHFDDNFLFHVPYDKYGTYMYSQANIEIPGFISNDTKSRALDINVPEETSERNFLKELSILIVNKFIDTFRYYSKEFHLQRIAYADVPDYKYSYKLKDGTIEGQYLMFFTPGIGGLTISSKNEYRYASKFVLNEVQQALTSNIEFKPSEIFLLNAKDGLVREDWRKAVLESVIALESAVYNFISGRLEKAGVSKSKRNEFLKDCGIATSIDILLKILLSDEETISDDLVQKCKSAINIRNKIVHNSLNDVPRNVSEQGVIAIEEVIKLLNQYSKKTF